MESHSSALRRAGAVGLSLVALAACQGAHAGPTAAPASTSPAETVSAAAAASAAPVIAREPFKPARAGCEAVPVFAGGLPNGRVCVEDAAASGLTVVDLSDAWTPRVFAADATTHSAPEYRGKYLDLAGQANSDLGLYGIPPTITVAARRLADDVRHTCDAPVDLTAIRDLSALLEAHADDRKVAALLRTEAGKAALGAIQAELTCAGLLRRGAGTGTLNRSTDAALDAFRRRHMIVGYALDGDTLAALALGGDELAFRGLLRVLRERIADAAEVIEDGSASGTSALVVGRNLDLSPFAPPAEEALEGGAPDLVGAATDQAARALGWTSPDAARAFLSALGPEAARSLRVAVALPAPPAYHLATMELRVEIDRGDVFYEPPGQAAAARRRLGEVRRPSLVVYAKDGDHEVPLVRWSTTIGGWKPERTDEGEITMKYKASDVGDRVWKQILTAPAWLPPDSTPEPDLVREAKDGSLAVKRDLVQPGYQNAYGLVMMIHHDPAVHGSQTTWSDHGIRTHGSVDYRSIRRGESHGCHRLYNQLALRLSGFVLEHRRHLRRGQTHVGYHRTVEWHDQTAELDVPTRGYLYELDPPVPVRVLEGHVAGAQPKPVSAAPRPTDGHAKG